MNIQWKLVPVEPTETMVICGFESEPDECFTDEKVWEQYQEMSGCQQAAFRAKLCWAAMIAAAPAPVPETANSGGEQKPYPDRLCHIDYTAHPYRCGCLSGDEEAQRRFDEYQRDTRLATAEGAVARLTAERDALQLLLNERDDLDDQLTSLEQRRHAEQQAGQAAEQRTEKMEDLLRQASMLILDAELLRAIEAALNPAAEAVSHE